MFEALSRHQRELARSCYNGYIAEFCLNRRRNYRLARRAEQHLVKSVVMASDSRPTRAQLLAAFKILIEEVESEWPDVSLPTRPHGL